MLKTLLRTLILVVIALAVLGGMAAWVKLTQHRPLADDPLSVSVQRDIVLPWDTTELWLDYSGAEGEKQPVGPRAANILFLLDTSGSMNVYRAATISAVFEMQRNIAASGASPRIGIMEFGSSAAVVTPFTSDMDELARRLAGSWPGAGGGTRFLAGLNGALAMLESTGQTGTVIMLTDGEAGESDEELARFYDQTWRESGHELYLVGIGTDANDPAVFYSLTDDPSLYIVSSTNTGIIPLLFQEVAARMGNALGRNVELHVPLAQPLWDWGEGGEQEPSDERRQVLPKGANSEIIRPGILFDRPYRWRVPIDPEIGGILETLHEPPELTYLSRDGERYRVSSTSDQVPKVLVVTWLLLLLLMLPAILYPLAELIAWLFRRRGEIPELEPVPWRKEYRPLPALPLRFAPDNQRIDWMPTLVIGLGRSGRQVLTQLKQNLADSFDRADTRPVLLALDVARDELRDGGEKAPGCMAPLEPNQVFILPAESCSLYDSVHRQQERVRADTEDPTAALDLTPYDGMAADALRLSKGTQGQTPLARLALLNDLANGSNSALLSRLGSALDEWRGLCANRRTAQIVLVANVGGGVGAGWLTDLVVLLRRLVCTDEDAGRAVELNLLLLGDEALKRGDLVPLTAPVLFAELDRLASAGGHPFRHRLARIDEADKLDEGAPERALDGWVRKRPHDGVFVLPRGGRGQTDAYPDAADALTLLIDQHRRTKLTFQLQAIHGAEAHKRAASGRECYTRIAIHNAVFPRSFFRELLYGRLLNLLGSNQLLFPELEQGAGEPSFQRLPVDIDSLCGSEAEGASSGLAAALCAVARGDCGAMTRYSVGQEHLDDVVSATRVRLISNANRELRERKIGVLGLAETTGAIADTLRSCAGEGGGDSVLELVATSLDAIRSQAHAWIELFFGSRAMIALGRSAQLANEQGLLASNAKVLDETLARLGEWSQAQSRVLMAPLVAADLADPRLLNDKLDRLLLGFVQRWLDTDKGMADALSERCGWELTAPGTQGAAIGINLVLRGAQTRRYGPSVADLRQFEDDLRTETEPVLDRNDDFHVLAMLSRTLDGDRDERALEPFVDRLKGSLRGHQSSLLATVPDTAHITDAELRELASRLSRTFRIRTRDAAEQVRVVSVVDRSRISVFQTVPLLESDLHTEPGGPAASLLHRPERRLMRETEHFADAVRRDGIELPAVFGIALEDRDRLRRFAQLYLNGQVLRSGTDDLWYVRGPNGLERLTLMPTQGLADAGAAFVAGAFDVSVDRSLAAEPYPYDGPADLVDYLEWLARQS